MTSDTELPPYESSYEHLEDEMRWLDLLIRLRTKSLRLQNEAAPDSQVARTTYITTAEVEWLLEGGVASGPDDGAAVRVNLVQLRGAIDDRVARSLDRKVPLTLPRLCGLFRLSPLESGAIVICLAPELRRKYDRLYAYLQDDITRKRPSVDLVLDLLCDGERERWSAHRLFSDGETLVRALLVRKVEDPDSPSGSSSLAQLLELDPRICAFLLGSDEIDARLMELTRFYPPAVASDPVPVDPEITAGLWNLVEHHFATDLGDRRKLVLHLHGPHGVGKRELALHICRQLGRGMLSIDAELLASRGTDAESLLRMACREGLLRQAVVLVEHADALLQDPARSLLKALQTAVSEYGWLILLSGTAPWANEHAFMGCLFHSAQLAHPDVPVRTAEWNRCLAEWTSEANEWPVQLAMQFRLTPGQIRAAVEQTRIRRLLKSEPEAITIIDLVAACREQSNHKLRELAVKIEPNRGWDDLVLPADQLAQLREICSQVRHQYRVFANWGFGRKLVHGKGLSALFAGPSGTGKTMAAEVMAREVELDLYKVDLSGVVSKYIGETEKNLARIFAEAETSNAIIFFDEADALFGKRTEVSDAHDRYANIETSYLLQKMEAYEGTVILATNLRENMDEAFTRRLRFVIDFPFPDEADRGRIWRTHFPPEAPVSPEIDYQFLAREFKVAGGSIKNIVLNAAFLAAATHETGSGHLNGYSGAIGMREIMHGARAPAFARIKSGAGLCGGRLPT